jgi:uncharacterized protein YfkK (UPF0435 family)
LKSPLTTNMIASLWDIYSMLNKSDKISESNLDLLNNITADEIKAVANNTHPLRMSIFEITEMAIFFRLKK